MGSISLILANESRAQVGDPVSTNRLPEVFHWRECSKPPNPTRPFDAFEMRFSFTSIWPGIAAAA
jgi:hypothetical protein